MCGVATMPLIPYLPNDLDEVQLCLLDIDDDVVVEHGGGAKLEGVRTVADLRRLRTWPGGLRLLIDRKHPSLVRVEPI
jgi:hypothetical protein